MPGVRTYKVTLTEDEQQHLRELVSSGKAAARKLNHARILLYADESAPAPCRRDPEIAGALAVGLRTVARVRQRFVEEGFEAALDPRPRPRGAYKFDGAAEARVIAVAKSDPPAGRKRWTLRLIADRLVALGHGPFSHETVRQALKKTP